MANKPVVFIDQWAIRIRNSDDPYKAPEVLASLHGLCLTGYVKGHPLLPDGPATTTRLLRLSVKNKIAESKNTIYKLGEPEAKFVEWLASSGKKIDDFDKEVA